jgi:6-phosphogluconolactonase
MYILTELTNTILVYNYNSLEFIQEISTLPAGFAGQTTSAAVHVSPDGKLLASSNRGHDSIAVFKIKADGGLDFITHVTGIKEPRDFRFSPDGNWLLAGQQNGDCVTVYKIDGEKFTETSSIAVPKPVCILFGGEI